MFTIGLTGGIGSGKSTVSQTLEQMGAYILNADLVGHRAYLPGADAWKAVVAEFGEGILAPETKEVDRRKLGAVVFGDPAKLQALNGIMWPRMAKMLESDLAELKTKGTKVVVLEAALLIEAKWTPLVDQVWVTIADEKAVIERLKNRNNFTEEQALARIRAQMTNEERMAHAQVVIDTNCTLEEVRQKTHALWDTHVSRRV